MKCFVTGASGFVGANLVHELIARGHEVRALLRPNADLRGLATADFERVSGDVSDRRALTQAMRGCDWCFHVAASYHLWLRDYAPMYASNVEGTRHVIEAAGDAGCSRIIYTSTVGCIGLPRRIDGTLVPTDEATPVSGAQMSNHYKRSKWQAEVVAKGVGREGPARGGRESQRSDWTTRRQAHANGAGDCGFPQWRAAGLPGYRA